MKKGLQIKRKKLTSGIFKKNTSYTGPPPNPKIYTKNTPKKVEKVHMILFFKSKKGNLI
jgi:hypothetical protein